ncbi:hypothetical protein D3C78_1559170 [compost metagenome]
MLMSNLISDAEALEELRLRDALLVEVVSEPEDLDGDSAGADPAADPAALDATIAAIGGAAPAGEPIAKVSLNGAQIASLVQILDGVAAKTMPPEAAKQIIAASFPLDTATIDGMIAPMLTVEAPAEPQA